MGLTLEEALFYVHNKLEITFPDSDWNSEFKKDKWGMLKKIYFAYLQRNYFQSVSLVLNQSEPTSVSSLESNIKGIGGVCIDNNSSLAALLNALGYGAYTASGEFVTDPNPNNHVHCVVPGDSEGELWGLDAGCCQIFHDIVPLHEVKKGQVFTFKCGEFEAEIRYDKENDNFKRVDVKGDYYHGKHDEGIAEKLIATFSVLPREHEHFKNTMKILFTDQNSLFFQLGLSFSRYTEINSDGSFQFVAFWGLSSYFVTNEAVERKTFASYEEMWPSLSSFFPLVKKSDYDEAVKVLEVCKKKKVDNEQ